MKNLDLQSEGPKGLRVTRGAGQRRVTPPSAANLNARALYTSHCRQKPSPL